MSADFLYQDRYWVNGEGRHDLDAMDPDHRSNLIPFLRRNAEALQFSALIDHVDAETMSAEDWLEQTPLMCRLVALEAGRTIDERRSTHERNVAHEKTTGYEKITVVVSDELRDLLPGRSL